MATDSIPISRNFYKIFVNILISYQNWELLIGIMNKTDLSIISQDFRTLQYIKESLIYCMDVKQRAEIRQRIEKAESKDLY